MKSEKLSISLEADLAEAIRNSASKEGVSVSSWIADASIQRARQFALEELVAADAAEFGALSDADVDRLIAEAHAASQDPRHADESRRAA
jgi:uncharacterized protein (DUF1778 family)